MMPSYRRLPLILLALSLPTPSALGAYPATLTPSDVDLSVSGSNSAFLGAQVLSLRHPGPSLCGDAIGPVSDFNDDGVDDAALGAPQAADSGGNRAGRAAVFLGRAGFTGALDLDDADLWVLNDGGGTNFPSALGVTDFNRDCVADLVVGHSDWNGGRGRVYVFFGSADLEPAAGAPAERLASTADLIFEGSASGDGLGASLSGGADVTEDGRSDLLVGAPGAQGWNASFNGAGRVYLLSSATNLTGAGPFDVESLSLTTLLGKVAFAALGGSVVMGPDADGGGAWDVVLGTPNNRGGSINGSGEAYFIRGEDLAGLAQISVVSDVAHVSYYGQGSNDAAGTSVSLVGDLNGDGVGEVAIVAPGNDGQGSEAGALYLFNGPIAARASPVSLGTADVIIPGGAANNQLSRVAPGGDLDGDGLYDLVIGLPRAGNGALSQVGFVSIFYGSESGILPLPATSGDTLLYGSHGGEQLGGALSMGGDLDGDGVVDLLIGAEGYRTFAGRVLAVRSGLFGDVDGDGSSTFAGDCDDFDGTIHPGAAEQCFDAIDQDCSGAVSDRDLDGDGWVAIACTDYEGDQGGDCDDDNDAVSPGALEICGDGLDNDCSGAEDDVPLDNDGDGFVTVACGGDDCDDQVATINPDAAEVCGDGRDNDCSGAADDLDLDGDGASACGEDADCDDGDPDIYPGATEVICDGIDQDCDGADERDGDGDGFPGCGEGALDCDDGDAGINPGVVEIPYDGIDQDCDGSDPTDVDGDGYIATQAGGDDCDDSEADINPGATDTPYDGIDGDCSGADPTDVDGDGYTATEVGGDDCDDSDAATYPGAVDTPYDGIDQDCDEEDNVDDDGDGFDAPVAGGDDCDDTDPDIYPGAYEVPDNGVDDDCDQRIDNYDGGIDHDGDGYVVGGEGPDDCEPLNPAVHPGAAEILDNGTDDNCNQRVDEGSEGTLYCYGSFPTRGACGLSGCGCDAGGAPPRGGPVAAALALLIVWALRRRPRPVAGEPLRHAFIDIDRQGTRLWSLLLVSSLFLAQPATTWAEAGASRGERGAPGEVLTDAEALPRTLREIDRAMDRGEAVLALTQLEQLAETQVGQASPEVQLALARGYLETDRPAEAFGAAHRAAELSGDRSPSVGGEADRLLTRLRAEYARVRLVAPPWGEAVGFLYWRPLDGLATPQLRRALSSLQRALCARPLVLPAEVWIPQGRYESADGEAILLDSWTMEISVRLHPSDGPPLGVGIQPYCGGRSGESAGPDLAEERLNQVWESHRALLDDALEARDYLMAERHAAFLRQSQRGQSDLILYEQSAFIALHNLEMDQAVAWAERASRIAERQGEESALLSEWLLASLREEYRPVVLRSAEGESPVVRLRLIPEGAFANEDSHALYWEVIAPRLDRPVLLPLTLLLPRNGYLVCSDVPILAEEAGRRSLRMTPSPGGVTCDDPVAQRVERTHPEWSSAPPRAPRIEVGPTLGTGVRSTLGGGLLSGVMPEVMGALTLGSGQLSLTGQGSLLFWQLTPELAPTGSGAEAAAASRGMDVNFAILAGVRLRQQGRIRLAGSGGVQWGSAGLAAFRCAPSAAEGRLEPVDCPQIGGESLANAPAGSRDIYVRRQGVGPSVILSGGWSPVGGAWEGLRLGAQLEGGLLILRALEPLTIAEERGEGEYPILFALREDPELPSVLPTLGVSLTVGFR